MKKTSHQRLRASRGGYLLRPAIAAALLQYMSAGWAVDIESANPDLKLSWNNTVKYSAAVRMKQQAPGLIVDANTDDGDRNFNRGLISNRIDLLSEFDLAYKDSGLRMTGAAWYDTVYNRANDNNSPATASPSSVSYQQFSAGTRDLHGRKAELLDAFVYTRFDAGGMPASVRLGRHTVLYGETLFFGDNGIAAGQAPVDVVKLLSVPGTQFKELLMPVSQLSGQLQLNPNVTLGGYYQFQWRANRIPGSGSYFSGADYVGPGAERFFAPGSFAHVYFDRDSDIKPRNSGQGGLQLRFRPDSEIAEFGLYAIRYHDKDFNLYLLPSATPALPSVGSYRQVYGEDIRAYGASASTTLAGANVALELVTRRNAPLVSDPVVAFGADNDGNPAYAVGNTAHANLSAIYVMNGSRLWDGGTLLAELAWNRRLSVSRNPAALDPNSTRDASGLRALFIPEYYQVLPGIDLSLPMGVGYAISGRSSTNVKFAGGAEHGGDFSIGASLDFRKKFKLSMNLVHFYGAAGTFISPNTPPAATILPYRQTNKDRDFVSVSLQSTF
ncbi:DUF1302 domain-containing protein [Duganella sp. BJB488]|uniref:DUF1302 domain-containing protein n=1 Tax=unclassified Duganella TaxID=2636909 RepID=UPI000E342AE4|nr:MULTISPECIES: DUF1302 domain-containing protein [unclassified Duganella]RFP09274.1 DUF1302 domain-containing protein [Duganella sp. BJB475]RFP13163.1 DUF1302 domain-containing protein [Duganella sp. BJB489]RFP17074.1 DUF1302 domain-containing protein [Duganella sp. BJB488]RFP25309.1 DUF1302 domain-containing protein [Duganella sp. BJB476]RFP31517.1 DUF1302 domain-containing protein [Duganella sp. BJB480]